jgi:uncharacterized protein (UPF0276 family)
MNFDHIGSGIGFRPELKSYIFLNRDKIDFLEIIADHYIDVPQWKIDELKLLKENFILIPHAINLSLGSIKGIDDNYLNKLKDLINFINPPYWSEHIAYTQAHNSDVGHLSPVIFNNETLSQLSENINQIKSVIKYPLILENITYHVNLPGRTFSDAEFLNILCEKCDIGLLLDITNLYINSKNFNFNPYHIIDNLNVENIIQLHYVGYESHPFQTVDTHAQKTQNEIFELMEYVFKKKMPKAVLLERDERFEFFNEIEDDLLRTKTMLNQYLHGKL